MKEWIYYQGKQTFLNENNLYDKINKIVTSQGKLIDVEIDTNRIHAQTNDFGTK